MRKTIFARWRRSFLTGLAVSLPALVTLAAVKWIFGTISSFTDTLLFFLPYFFDPKVIYVNGQSGAMFWYWSLLALMLAAAIITLTGVLAQYYIGRRMLEWLDTAMMNVPVVNKFYGAIKQVNEAFAGNKNSFKTVVMVEFPREGIYSVGFITSEQHAEVQQKTREKIVAVFVPTTPNPTSGFLILVPEDKVTKLDMSVAEGIKYIVSLGSISPELLPPKLKMIESASGIILRTRPLTETSLIVHWLTPDLGRLATVAKGARRPKSPFAGKLDLFYTADFSFTHSRRSELHTLREVSLRETRGAIRTDLAKLQQAAYVANFIEQATETETPLPEIFELARGVLDFLCMQTTLSQTILAFELKMLRELGLEPDADESRLTTGAKKIATLLADGSWADSSRLKLSAAQDQEIRQWLHGFLIFHLGRLPRGRAGALGGEA